MNNETMYREFARLLGAVYDCSPFPYQYRTRWNNRVAGSGRYPNHGTIRIYGDVVHVSLRNPYVRMVGTKEEALAAVEHALIKS